MNRRCPTCSAAMGPHESRSCLSCRQRAPQTNSDRIVAVLEQSDTPLNTWDIVREAKALDGTSVWLGYLSSDERLCWAGRRMWGLYRHGLVPGVRTLSKVAAVYIHAAGSITTKELYFVMRRVGYRFSPNSLTATLSYEPWVVRLGWHNTPRTTNAVRKEMHASLQLANGMTLDDIIRRAEDQIERELAIYDRRLA